MVIKQFPTVLSLLTELSTLDSSFVILNGGTDIMPAVNRNVLETKTLIDLESLSGELHYIKELDDAIEIGALVKLSEVANHQIILKKIPQLAKAIGSIGSRQIRNMGTLTGNVANASPIGDTIPVLMVQDATINIISLNSERHLSINDFYIGYKKKNLAKNEMIKSISIPFNHRGSQYDFFKVAIRPQMAVSKVNLAYALGDGRTIFASGGVRDIPVRLHNLEKHFNDSGLSRSDLAEVLQSDISPISDIRSTSTYRSTVLLNLIFPLYLTHQESSRA